MFPARRTVPTSRGARRAAAGRTPASAGFRGPVLRENYTPVLRFTFAVPVIESDLLYVNLGGRGIRDLTRARGGLLVLAGPVGDGPGSYQLYFWDGKDCLPGTRTG